MLTIFKKLSRFSWESFPGPTPSVFPLSPEQVPMPLRCAPAVSGPLLSPQAPALGTPTGALLCVLTPRPPRAYPPVGIRLAGLLPPTLKYLSDPKFREFSLFPEPLLSLHCAVLFLHVSPPCYRSLRAGVPTCTLFLLPRHEEQE